MEPIPLRLHLRHDFKRPEGSGFKSPRFPALFMEFRRGFRDCDRRAKRSNGVPGPPEISPIGSFLGDGLLTGGRRPPESRNGRIGGPFIEGFVPESFERPTGSAFDQTHPQGVPQCPSDGRRQVEIHWPEHRFYFDTLRILFSSIAPSRAVLLGRTLRAG